MESDTFLDIWRLSDIIWETLSVSGFMYVWYYSVWRHAKNGCLLWPHVQAPLLIKTALDLVRITFYMGICVFCKSIYLFFSSFNMFCDQCMFVIRTKSSKCPNMAKISVWGIFEKSIKMCLRRFRFVCLRFVKSQNYPYWRCHWDNETGWMSAARLKDTSGPKNSPPLWRQGLPPFCR